MTGAAPLHPSTIDEDRSAPCKASVSTSSAFFSCPRPAKVDLQHHESIWTQWIAVSALHLKKVLGHLYYALILHRQRLRQSYDWWRYRHRHRHRLLLYFTYLVPLLVKWKCHKYLHFNQTYYRSNFHSVCECSFWFLFAIIACCCSLSYPLRSILSIVA